MTHPFVTIKLGEDIDDFVVRTKSKTDQIIRDYTAVASNNFKGVSVLTEQGDQRNTYDIDFMCPYIESIYVINNYIGESNKRYQPRGKAGFSIRRDYRDIGVIQYLKLLSTLD